jgi:hypothetical protein
MKLKNNKIFIKKPRKNQKKKLFFLNNIWQIKIKILNKIKFKIIKIKVIILLTNKIDLYLQGREKKN